MSDDSALLAVLREILDLHVDVMALSYGEGSVTWYGFWDGTDWVRAADERPVLLGLRKGVGLPEALPLLLAPKPGVTLQTYPRRTED